MFLHFLVLYTCVLYCSSAKIQQNLLMDKTGQELTPSHVSQIDEGSFGDLRYITVRNDKDIYYVIHFNSSLGTGGSQADAQNIKKIIQELIDAQTKGSKKHKGKKNPKGGKGKNGKGGSGKKNCKAQKCNCNNSTQVPEPTKDGQTIPTGNNTTQKPPTDTTSSSTTRKPADPATTTKQTTEDYYGGDDGADYGDNYY